MFDEISGTYDRVNRILSFGRDQNWRKKVEKYLPLKRKLKILDLATGTGDQLFALFETSDEIDSAIGIDLAEKMLEIAKVKAEKKPYFSKITFQKADAEDLPFADNSFDVVTFSFGIRNVKDPKRALEEMHRVLTPEGRALILEFSLPPPPFDKMYLLYLRYLLPPIGGFFSHYKGAYKYLNQTIETFPHSEAFLDLMRQASFQNVQKVSMALGAVSLYIGEK